MERIRSGLVGVAAFLLGGVLTQVLSALAFSLVSFLVGLVLIVVTDHPVLVLAGISVVWLMISLTAVAWFSNHQENRAKRTLNLTEAMQISDSAVGGWLARQSTAELGRAVEELRAASTVLLERLCGLLAYRVPYLEKGATFLVLLNDDMSAAFGLFAHVHHDDTRVPGEIRKSLRRDFGMAGQAVNLGTCVVVENCASPGEGIQWSPNHMPPRFAGRAAVRIRGTINDKETVIGALCFDVRRPWLLSEEDQALLQSFADKLATLCGLWIRLHAPKAGVRVLRDNVLK